MIGRWRRRRRDWESQLLDWADEIENETARAGRTSNVVVKIDDAGSVKIEGVQHVHDTPYFHVFVVDCQTKYPVIDAWYPPDAVMIVNLFKHLGDASSRLVFTSPFGGWQTMVDTSRYWVYVVMWRYPEEADEK